MLTSLAPFNTGTFGRPPSAAEHDAAGLGHRAGRGIERGGELIEAAAGAAPRAAEETAGGSFDKTAKQLVGRALDSLGQDLGRLFKGLGDLAGGVKELFEASLQPIREALAQGLDFSAEIQFAAVRQQTLITQGGYAQDIDLVAKSLTIEVNHTTGEVAIDLQSLSIQQSVAVGFGGGAAQDFDPNGLGGPARSAFGDLGLGDFIERLLKEAGPETTSEETAKTAPAAPGTDLALVDDLLPAVETGTEALRPQPKEAENDDNRRARIALRGAERFQNEAGQFVTRLRLDLAVQIASRSELQDLAETLPADGRGSGFDFHA